MVAISLCFKSDVGEARAEFKPTPTEVPGINNWGFRFLLAFSGPWMQPVRETENADAGLGMVLPIQVLGDDPNWRCIPHFFV